VKVSNRKGIANQTGPESCVAHREVRDEALTGEPAGRPLSRESFKLVQGADAVSVAEGNMDRRDSAGACFDPAWSKNLACRYALLHVNREVSCLAASVVV
jgi:RNA-directed DNA polymerase